MHKNPALLPTAVATVVLVAIVAIVVISAAHSDAHTTVWVRDHAPEGEMLWLRDDGTYRAAWSMEGPARESKGRWHKRADLSTEDIIALEPSGERDARQVFATEFFVRKTASGERVLVPAEEVVAFDNGTFGDAPAFHALQTQPAR